MKRLLLSLCVLVPAGLMLPASADDKGWVPLFNGKDLTGWKLHPEPNKRDLQSITKRVQADKVLAYHGVTKDGKDVPLWRVEAGVLIGSGPHSHLFSERDDYQNFHYRVEASINDKGNSGQYFRTQFGTGFPKGYEAQINATGGDKIKTGSLYFPTIKEVLVLDTAPHKPDEWFTQEVIAVGNHLTVLVNGKKTVEWKDPENRFKQGHFALQGHDPGTVVKFRKIEVKELPK